MLIIACSLVFLCVTLLIGSFGARMSSAPRRAVVGRLRDLTDTLPTTYEATLTDGTTMAAPAPRRWWNVFGRTASSSETPEITVVSLRPDTPSGMMLLHAGYRSESALRIYVLSRMACALTLAGIPVLMVTREAIKPQMAVLSIAIGALVGYLLPKIYVNFRARARQHRLRLGLPDALDLMVVCVEAGMGLNQALVRVSEELRDTHPEMADEFRLVNLEIRAGRTRPDALRNMGERTGVDDIISLVSMIIQTDKFGTSIARSLRVHSDSLRTERRQRAEEAAAKTTIKLIFPLLFCIFPSLFVIILGPAAMHIWRVFGKGV